MIVLGINETHCATAAVLRDGRIIGCASEERFSRLKNDAGYPRRAIDALLHELGITPPADRRGGPGGRPRSLAGVAEPGAARRGVRQGVLRRLVAVAAPDPREEGAEVGRQVRPHRRLPRQVRHLAARAARLRHRAPGPRRRTASCASTTTPVTPPPPTGARASAGATRSSSPTTTPATASARPRPPAGASTLDAARGHAERAGLARRLLLLRDARAGHEVRRARVQGDGHGARTRRRSTRRGRRRRCARSSTSRKAGPRASAGARRASATSSCSRATVGLRFDCGRGRRPAPARGRAAALEPPHARALRRRAARPGRRRLHEREGQHAARRRRTGWRSCSPSRPAATSRTRWARPISGTCEECARRGVAAAPQPFGPAYLGTVGDRRGGGGGDPRAAASRASTRWPSTTASRSASPSSWSRTAWWPAARGGWSSGRARSAIARSSPIPRTTGWSALINRMIKNRDFWMPFAPDGAGRAGGRLPRQSEGLRLALHDAGHADAPGGAGRAHRRAPSPGRHRAAADPRARRGTRSTTR